MCYSRSNCWCYSFSFNMKYISKNRIIDIETREYELEDLQLHIWIGPFGVHLYWPLYGSAFDYEARWREEI